MPANSSAPQFQACSPLGLPGGTSTIDATSSPPALWIRRRPSNLRIRGPAGMAGFSSMARGSMGFRLRPYQPARRAGVSGRLASPIARGLACRPRLNPIRIQSASPPTRSRLRREGTLIGGRLKPHQITDAKSNTSFTMTNSPLATRHTVHALAELASLGEQFCGACAACGT